MSINRNRKSVNLPQDFVISYATSIPDIPDLVLR